MERSVRYIRVEGIKPALCFRGKHRAYAIINDELFVRAVEISLKDHDLGDLVARGILPYPVGDFTARMQAVADRKGLTLRARALLALPEEADEPATLPPDEIAATEPVARPSSSSKAPTGERRAPKRAERPPTSTATPKPSVGERGGLIAKLAVEYGIAAQQLRLALRLAGLRAPYTDEALIRSKLK